MGTPSICTFSQKNMKFAPLVVVCIFGLLVESAPQGRGKNNNRKFNQKAVEIAKKNNPLNPKNTKLAKKVAKEEYDEALDRANKLFKTGFLAAGKALNAEDLAKTVIDNYGEPALNMVNNAGEAAVKKGKQRINKATQDYQKEIKYVKDVTINQAIADSSKFAQKQINKQLKAYNLGILVKPAEQLRQLGLKNVKEKLGKYAKGKLGKRKALAEAQRRGKQKYNKDFKPAVNTKIGETLEGIQANNN